MGKMLKTQFFAYCLDTIKEQFTLLNWFVYLAIYVVGNLIHDSFLLESMLYGEVYGVQKIFSRFGSKRFKFVSILVRNTKTNTQLKVILVSWNKPKTTKTDFEFSVLFSSNRNLLFFIRGHPSWHPNTCKSIVLVRGCHTGSWNKNIEDDKSPSSPCTVAMVSVPIGHSLPFL